MSWRELSTYSGRAKQSRATPPNSKYRVISSSSVNFKFNNALARNNSPTFHGGMKNVRCWLIFRVTLYHSWFGLQNTMDVDLSSKKSGAPLYKWIESGFYSLSLPKSCALQMTPSLPSSNSFTPFMQLFRENDAIRNTLAGKRPRNSSNTWLQNTLFRFQACRLLSCLDANSAS